ncbi:hypothetical protein T484DRAFT_1776391 [Baffinella frigidus]|nr:hypothetical protein T484DRAFT_1776391 [Cryptophyta sp. CCMP2293]
MSLGTQDSPMRERLSMHEMSAMSPASKGKAPIQLPPPPQGMTSANVAKWRTEMAKILKRRLQDEDRVARSATKDRDRMQREDDKINAQVSALTKRLMANAPTSAGAVTPQTQIASMFAHGEDESEYGSEEAAEDEEEEVEYVDSEEEAEGGGEEDGDQEGGGADEGEMVRKENRNLNTTPVAKGAASARWTPTAGSGGGGVTVKAGPLAASLHQAITGLDAVDEVSKVLAARKKRIEEAERSKLAPNSNTTRAAQEQATHLELQQLRSFEKRIQNKHQASPAAASPPPPPTSSGREPAPRASLSGSVVAVYPLALPGEGYDECDTSMDFVIDEIPDAPPLPAAQPSPAVGPPAPAAPCGLGVALQGIPAGGFLITGLIPASSAFRSELLRVGDRVEYIDGCDVASLPIDAVAAMLLGPPATQVLLDVIRDVGGSTSMRIRAGISRRTGSEDFLMACPEARRAPVAPARTTAPSPRTSAPQLLSPAPLAAAHTQARASALSAQHHLVAIVPAAHSTPSSPFTPSTALSTPAAAPLATPPRAAAPAAPPTAPHLATPVAPHPTTPSASPAPPHQAHASPAPALLAPSGAAAAHAATVHAATAGGGGERAEAVGSQAEGVAGDGAGGAEQCGVGLGFSYDPASGGLRVRAMAPGIAASFSEGDHLVEVDGIRVDTNAMVAASLLWGAPGSRVTLRVAHPSPDARAATLLSATLVRHATDLDSNALTTAGAKTCGVGVVLVLHPPSGCFSVKRTIADGPAHRAGLLQGDILTRIGAQPLTNFPKERLPSLLLGPEGSSVRIAYLRDGQSYPAEVDVVRSVDAAKAQRSA